MRPAESDNVVLIDPTESALSDAVGRAIAVAHEHWTSTGRRRVEEFWAGVVRRIVSEPSGSVVWPFYPGPEAHEFDYAWHMGPGAHVGGVWWADVIGRKHVRFGPGRNAEEYRHWDKLPPLCVLYPESAFPLRKNGRVTVRCLCACGAAGLPGDLGWAGECCGPCHDRRLDRPDEPPGPFGLRDVPDWGGYASAGPAFTCDSTHAVVLGDRGQLVAVVTAGGRGRVVGCLPVTAHSLAPADRPGLAYAGSYLGERFDIDVESDRVRRSLETGGVTLPLWGLQPFRGGIVIEGETTFLHSPEGRADLTGVGIPTCFSGDGRFLFTRATAGGLARLDLDTNRSAPLPPFPAEPGIWTAHASHQGGVLVLGAHQGQLWFWRAGATKWETIERNEPPILPEWSSWAGALAVLRERFLVVVGRMGVLLFDLQRRRCVAQVWFPVGRDPRIAADPAGELLAVAWENMLRLWPWRLLFDVNATESET